MPELQYSPISKQELPPSPSRSEERSASPSLNSAFSLPASAPDSGHATPENLNLSSMSAREKSALMDEVLALRGNRDITPATLESANELYASSLQIALDFIGTKTLDIEPIKILLQTTNQVFCLMTAFQVMIPIPRYMVRI